MTINFSDITEDSGQESIESEYWHSYLYSCISFMFSNVCLSQKKKNQFGPIITLKILEHRP